MSDLPETVISAEYRQRWGQLAKDLWNYRDLFFAFLERDIKVRYKQTVFGVVWVLLQPLVTAGAFALILGGIARMPVDGLPHTLFYVAALVPWVCFAQGVSGAASSLEGNAGLISKIYFPRLLVPLSVVFGTLPDFAIGFVLINGLAAATGHWSLWLWVVMPPLLLVQLAAAGGLGLLLAALNAQYRDIRYVVPFIVQTGMLATPIIYPLSGLPHWARMCQGGNPMALVVGGYRWALGGMPVPAALIVFNGVVAILLLAGGLWFFRHREKRLVDLL